MLAGNFKKTKKGWKQVAKPKRALIDAPKLSASVEVAMNLVREHEYDDYDKGNEEVGAKALGEGEDHEKEEEEEGGNPWLTNSKY